MMDKGLYGHQIGHAMDGIVDLYAADEVSNLTPPVIAICNTGVSGTEGEHLVVICNISFGMHPIVYGFSESITNKSKSWIYNDIRLQDPPPTLLQRVLLCYCILNV